MSTGFDHSVLAAEAASIAFHRALEVAAVVDGPGVVE